jgi:phytoene/squalene synthetase
MKKIFDDLSNKVSRITTKDYSTSFYSSVKLLEKSIQQDIFNIYGFVRLTDEIVDTFTDYKQEELLNKFEAELWDSIHNKISVNPILNSFQQTVNKYNIDHSLISSFLKSMRLDLRKQDYQNEKDFKEYIYGSADVVGLMCLQVFVSGDKKEYEELKEFAIRLGSAFQKVNFLRDIKEDATRLGRSYFPDVDYLILSETEKDKIIDDIKSDFETAYLGIAKLPSTAKLGVYTAYKYYHALFKKIKKTPANKIVCKRIRVSNLNKLLILFRCKIVVRLNLLYSKD